MLGSLFTAFVLLLTAIAVFYKFHINETTEGFFNKDYTTALKGVSCILVVMVHIPQDFTNPLQDMVGSFAMVGVSLFFLISAYGLKCGVTQKPGYLKHFWRNRLSALLIPWFTVNILSVVTSWALNGADAVKILKGLFAPNSYVTVTLILYLVFYLVYAFLRIDRKKKDALICGIVLALSLITALTPVKLVSHWYVECLGFPLGILTFNYLDRIKSFAVKKQLVKSVMILCLTAVCGVLYLKLKSMFFVGDYILRFALNFLLIAAIYMLTVKASFKSPLLKGLGNISYEVYLTHFTVMALLGKVITAQSGILADSFVLCTFLFTILLSWIVMKADKGIILKLRKQATSNEQENVIRNSHRNLPL